MPEPRRGAGGIPRSALHLAVVLVVALAVRVAFIPWHGFAADRVLTPDSSVYLELGRNLAEEGSFGRSPESPAGAVENPSTFEIFRTPGYPAVIAALSRITPYVLPATVCLGVLLDVALVALVYLTARSLVEPGWALAAAAFVAVDLGHVVYANMVMSDALFAFLVGLAACALMYPAASRPLVIPLAAVALTFACAVRPVGTLMFAPAAAMLALRRVAPRRIVAFAMLALAFPVLWTVRNGLGAGFWSVSNALDYNLCLVTAARVEAASTGTTFRDASRALVGAAVRSSPGDDPARRSAAFVRTGLGVLRSHPGATLREAGLSLGEFAFAGERRNLLQLIGLPTAESAAPSIGESVRGGPTRLAAAWAAPRSELLLVAVPAAWNFALWIAATAGSVALARGGRWPELTLLGGLVAYVAAASIAVANGRMRMPVTGVLAVLAVYGIRQFTRARSGAA